MLEQVTKRTTHVSLVYYASVEDMLNDNRIKLEEDYNIERIPYIADKWIAFDTIYESVAGVINGTVKKLVPEGE